MGRQKWDGKTRKPQKSETNTEVHNYRRSRNEDAQERSISLFSLCLVLISVAILIWVVASWFTVSGGPEGTKPSAVQSATAQDQTPAPTDGNEVAGEVGNEDTSTSDAPASETDSSDSNGQTAENPAESEAQKPPDLSQRSFEVSVLVVMLVLLAGALIFFGAHSMRAAQSREHAVERLDAVIRQLRGLQDELVLMRNQTIASQSPRLAAGGYAPQAGTLQQRAQTSASAAQTGCGTPSAVPSPATQGDRLDGTTVSLSNLGAVMHAVDKYADGRERTDITEPDKQKIAEIVALAVCFRDRREGDIRDTDIMSLVLDHPPSFAGSGNAVEAKLSRIYRDLQDLIRNEMPQMGYEVIRPGEGELFDEKVHEAEKTPVPTDNIYFKGKVAQCTRPGLAKKKKMAVPARVSLYKVTPKSITR